MNLESLDHKSTKTCLGEVEAHHAGPIPEQARLDAAAIVGVGEQGHHVRQVLGRDVREDFDPHREEHLAVVARTAGTGTESGQDGGGLSSRVET